MSRRGRPPGTFGKAVKTVNLNTRIDAELYASLKAFAKRHRKTVAWATRHCLRKVLPP